jgi:hypothetical protein
MTCSQQLKYRTNQKFTEDGKALSVVFPKAVANASFAKKSSLAD